MAATNADGPFQISERLRDPRSQVDDGAHGRRDRGRDTEARRQPEQLGHPGGFLANVLRGRLGMDSGDYSIDTRMLVTHGHHFDFWNCPENQILGLLIANSVGMFIVDRNIDPFLDIRGIALQGNPYIDFADAFAGWPVFNSWVSHDPSVRFAHQVQHMPNLDRQLIDSIMFSETRAALIGTFGIALNYTEPAEEEEEDDDDDDDDEEGEEEGEENAVTVVTPGDSREALCSGEIGLAEYSSPPPAPYLHRPHP